MSQGSAERFVVDTSVLVRWFLQQSGWRSAMSYRTKFMSGEVDLLTTDCARFELPHVLRKRGLLAGTMSHQQYLMASRAIDDLGIVSRRLDADEVEQCAFLAAKHNFSFFDAVFVFECLATGRILLTADLRLASAAELLTDVEYVVDL